MHSPETLAFEIFLGRKKKKNGKYRTPIISIWHIDPEKDGTDDSCGWFMRDRHGDKEVLEKIKKEIEFNFKNNYWFTPDGIPKFSTSGIVLEMYSKASWIYFNMNRKKHQKFNKKYLWDILHFAENPIDSLSDYITEEYRYRLIQHDRSLVESQEERIHHLARVVYGDILRKTRKWYHHPRWHINHWQIQFHPLQKLKRRYWDKCSVCGKRGFTGSAHSDWNGTKIWHSECDHAHQFSPNNLVEPNS